MWRSTSGARRHRDPDITGRDTYHARVKALTMTQPWASLVAIGENTIETRSWSTRYRGPLAIHAAKGFPADARALCQRQSYRAVLVRHGYASADDLPLGCVLAVARWRTCSYSIGAACGRHAMERGVECSRSTRPTSATSRLDGSASCFATCDAWPFQSPLAVCSACGLSRRASKRSSPLVAESLELGAAL